MAARLDGWLLIAEHVRGRAVSRAKVKLVFKLANWAAEPRGSAHVPGDYRIQNQSATAFVQYFAGGVSGTFASSTCFVCTSHAIKPSK